MHIINYFQPQLGYEEYYVPRTQIKLGHDVFVVTSNRYYPFPSYNSVYKSILGDRFSPNQGFNSENGIPTVRLPTLFEFDSSVSLKHLKNTLNKLQPDVIHIHGFFFPITLQALKSSPSYSKIVLDAHMIPPLTGVSKISDVLKLLYLNVFHKKIYDLYIRKKIHAIYVTKEQVANYLKKKYRIFPPIVPLGVDTDLFNHSKYDHEALRKRLEFESEDFILFYSGKIIRRKGLLDLVNIYNIIREKKDNFGLLMVGGGDAKYVKYLLEKVNPKYRDKLRVIPFTHHHDLPQYMSVGNLGCWLGEIPSASINEILGVGRPILVNIFEGKNLSNRGYIFAKQHISVQESVSLIQKLANDIEFYKKCCLQARKFAIENLDWKVTTETILSIYNKRRLK